MLVGQKWLDDEYKGPDMLPKVNKADMTGTMESNNEYLKSHCGVMRESVVCDKCLVIHDHNRPVKVYSYDPKDGHRSVKIVDSAVGNHDPQSGQKFILMINQAICTMA